MKKIILILILLSGFTALNAEIPERPDPPRLVNDFAGILNQNEASSLETKLVNGYGVNSERHDQGRYLRGEDHPVPFSAL